MSLNIVQLIFSNQGIASLDWQVSHEPLLLDVLCPKKKYSAGLEQTSGSFPTAFNSMSCNNTRGNISTIHKPTPIREAPIRNIFEPVVARIVKNQLLVGDNIEEFQIDKGGRNRWDVRYNVSIENLIELWKKLT